MVIAMNPKKVGEISKMHISGANVIGLQNEQLENCLGFDEETFNYPPVEEIPYCLELICPFWLFPWPKGLSVSCFYSASVVCTSHCYLAITPL